jgi:small conductance mechanosensitive channel
MTNTISRAISNYLVASIALIAVTFAMPGIAGDAPGEDAPYLEHADHLEARLQGLDRDIKGLRAKAKGASGGIARIINRRLERKEIEILEVFGTLARITLEEETSGGDVSKYRPHIVDKLEKLPDTLLKRIVEIRDSQRERADASADITVKDKLALVKRGNQLSQHLNILYRGLIENREMAQAYGLDVSAQDVKLTENLSDRASDLSIALELVQEDVSSLELQASDNPDDKDIAAALKIAIDLVGVLADSLNKSIEIMTALDLVTDEYRQQLIVARGAITLDIFDPDVAFGLVGNLGRKLAEWAGERLPQLFLNLLIFALIMLVFSRLAVLAKKLVTKSFDASKLNISQLLRDITIASVKNVVMLIGLLIALGQMGISVGPLLAGFGVAGFIIGFALQDTLGNFASGLMILLYRPFDVGDVVEIGGIFGKVKALSMVNTTMLTLDNQTLILPNTKIWQEVIKNVTAQSKRRVDLVFGISYSDDISKAEKILSGILEEHDLILDNPEPIVRLHELGDSSVNFIVRPWVKTDDYWDVYWDVTREVKLRFDREGVSIPFPQQDVHIHSEAVEVARPLAGDGKLVMQGHVSKSAALPGEEGEDGDGGNEGASGGESSTN